MELNFKRMGEGPSVVILHGLFGTLDNWFGVGKHLAQKFDITLVDQRNHGLSPHSDDWNYELMADDVRKLIESEEIESPVVIGHSMGGKTAMELATSADLELSGLVVVDIAPKYYPPHHGTILEALNSLPLDRIQSRTEADEEMSKLIEDFGVRQFLLKNLKRNDDGSYSWKMNLAVIENNIEVVGQALDKGRVFEGETKFIRGANSDYILDEDVDLIQNHFPKATISSIKNAGHWVHAEQPKDFILTLENFLERVI